MTHDSELMTHTSSAPDGMDDVNGRAGSNRRVKTLEVAHLFRIKEDVDEGPKLAGFVTDVESQAGVVAFQRVNDLAHRTSHGGDAAALPRARQERARDRDGDSTFQRNPSPANSTGDDCRTSSDQMLERVLPHLWE